MPFHHCVQEARPGRAGQRFSSAASVDGYQEQQLQLLARREGKLV
jgi:hypothetical protein